MAKTVGGGGPEPGQGDASGRAVKKDLRTPHKRQLVDDLQKRFGVGFSAPGDLQSVLPLQIRCCVRIRDIDADPGNYEVRIHYDYRRGHVFLQREGWRDNHKRVYREQGVLLCLKRPRCNKAAKNWKPVSQGVWQTPDTVPQKSGALSDHAIIARRPKNELSSISATNGQFQHIAKSIRSAQCCNELASINALLYEGVLGCGMRLWWPGNTRLI